MANFRNKKPITHKEMVVIKRILDKHIGHSKFDYYTFDEKLRRSILKQISEESGVLPPRNMYFVQRVYKKLYNQQQRDNTKGCSLCGCTLDEEYNNAHIKAYKKFYKLCLGCSLRAIDGIFIDTVKCHMTRGCFYCNKHQTTDSITYRKFGVRRGEFRLCGEHKQKLNIDKNHPIMAITENSN